MLPRRPVLPGAALVRLVLEPMHIVIAEAEVVARFVDHHGRPTQAYPFNPNGSPEGLTAVTTADCRITAMMPHPERVYREVQMSWSSRDASALSPWMQMFRNARRWVG